MKKKILIITPIKHIENIVNKLKKYFIVKIIEDPSYYQVIKIIKNYEIVFTNPNMSKVRIDKCIMNAAKNLQIICTASTGTNHIDLKTAKLKKIDVISLRNKKKTINKITSTAEHALSLLLATIRKIPHAINYVRKKSWDYRPFIGRQLNYLNIGVIGYGRLGKSFVKYVTPLAKRILVYEKFGKKISNNKKVTKVGLNYLLSNSDIISIHIHADKENINFIDKNKLKKMKKNVLIINTSRGEVIHEKDLIEFVRKNKDSYYSTDVISSEINNKFKSPVLKEFKKNKRVLITPHIAGMTKEAQEIAYTSIVENLINKIFYR